MFGDRRRERICEKHCCLQEHGGVCINEGLCQEGNGLAERASEGDEIELDVLRCFVRCPKRLGGEKAEGVSFQWCCLVRIRQVLQKEDEGRREQLELDGCPKLLDLSSALESSDGFGTLPRHSNWIPQHHPSPCEELFAGVGEAASRAGWCSPFLKDSLDSHRSLSLKLCSHCWELTSNYSHHIASAFELPSCVLIGLFEALDGQATVFLRSWELYRVELRWSRILPDIQDLAHVPFSQLRR